VTSPPSLATWLRTRTPSPPDALAIRIDAMTAASADAPASADALVACAERAMSALLHDGCLTRGSALDLLAIDALITYAFEVAADEPERIEEHTQRALAVMARLSEPYPA
jgi:hypothetical protein